MLKKLMMGLCLVMSTSAQAEPLICWNFAVSTYEIAKALGPNKYLVVTRKSDYQDRSALLLTTKTSFKITGSINQMRWGHARILGLWVEKLKEKGTYNKDGFDQKISQYQENEACFKKCEELQFKPMKELEKNVKLANECMLGYY